MAGAGVMMVVLFWLAAGWAGVALIVRDVLREFPHHHADGGDVVFAVGFTLAGPFALAIGGAIEVSHVLRGRLGGDWAKVARIWGFR